METNKEGASRYVGEPQRQRIIAESPLGIRNTEFSHWSFCTEN